MEIGKAYTKRRTLSLECVQSSGEYVLPDYQGDVRKVLYSRARAVNSGKYQNGDTLEAVGIVAYDVIYLDTDGVMTPVSFTGDYEVKFRCDGERYVDSEVKSRVAGYTLRLMGPRKFMAKANVECECSIAERAEYSLTGADALGDTAELLCSTVGIEGAAWGESAEIEYAEDIERIDGAIVDEVEVLLTSAEARAVTATRTEGGAEVRGEIFVSALIKCADKMPYLATREVEFCAEVASAELDDDMDISASVDILSLTSSVNPEESGVAIVFNMIATASVSGVANTPLRIVKDCYSTERETGTECADFSYSEYIASRAHTEKISSNIPRAQASFENVRNVLFASADVKVEDVRIVQDQLAVNGNLRFSGIACEINDNGEISYVPVKLDVPFAQNVNYDIQIPENARAFVHAEVSSAKLEVDAANVIPSVTLNLYTRVSADMKERCVDSVKVGEARYDSDPSLLTVYYPERGESLFEVGKKFHTSTMHIARENELSEAVCSAPGSASALSDISYLIIKK